MPHLLADSIVLTLDQVRKSSGRYLSGTLGQVRMSHSSLSSSTLWLPRERISSGCISGTGPSEFRESYGVSSSETLDDVRMSRGYYYGMTLGQFQDV